MSRVPQVHYMAKWELVERMWMVGKLSKPHPNITIAVSELLSRVKIMGYTTVIGGLLAITIVVLE